MKCGTGRVMVLTAAQCQVFMQIRTVALVLHLQMKNAASDKTLLHSCPLLPPRLAQSSMHQPCLAFKGGVR